jgi:NADP-dependent 3-hydroxy acid dehydrogenase YdfG
MIARRKERLDDLREELGERAVGIPGDVTDLEGLEAAIDEAARKLGGVDAVIAVAGKSMTGTITTGTPERWRDLLNLNLIGPLATVRYAARHFPASGRRDIVLVASAGAITPIAGVGIYAASKRGLRAAFDALRLELAPSGVNVSLVLPGMFETEGLTLEGLILDGDIPPLDAPICASGSAPAPPTAVADSIAYLINLPEGVCINELVVRPTGELFP